MDTVANHYDVGVIGVWSGCNYGSVATYYALHEVLKSLGKSVLMIDKPLLGKEDPEFLNTHSRRFANEHYVISPRYYPDDFKKLNSICDSFIVGSDQVWNYGISKHSGYMMYLDFADSDKRKISYASSLGHSVDFAPSEERTKISKLLSRFDAISVREDSGVELLKKFYGINAVQVMDPVFLLDSEYYKDLARRSVHRESEPFIAAYILDPTPEKREVLLKISEKLGGMKVVVMLDGLPWKYETNKSLMDMPECVDNLQVEDWLYYISECSFLLTDSCHGASFGIIFKKRFAAISNKLRGHTRFVSLLKSFGLSERLVVDPARILNEDLFFDELNTMMLDSVMKSKSQSSIQWLKNSLSDVKKSEFELLYQNLCICSEESPVSASPAEQDLRFFGVPLAFFFDDTIWEKHIILGTSTLIPLSNSSPPRKYAYTLLNCEKLSERKILKDKKYHVLFEVKFHTSSEYINFHIYNSVSKEFMIVKRLKIARKDMNIWNKIDIDFVADNDGYDSLMIGALQISGENRFISFKSLNVTNV